MDEHYLRDHEEPENPNSDPGKSRMLVLMVVGLLLILGVLYLVTQFV